MHVLRPKNVLQHFQSKQQEGRYLHPRTLQSIVKTLLGAENMLSKYALFINLAMGGWGGGGGGKAPSAILLANRCPALPAYFYNEARASACDPMAT